MPTMYQRGLDDGYKTARKDSRTTHCLKIWPQYFSAVIAGKKTFEIRKDDRGFRTGDRLLLREWGPGATYTGATAEARITYIYRGEGLAPEYAVLGIQLETELMHPEIEEICRKYDEEHAGQRREEPT